MSNSYPNQEPLSMEAAAIEVIRREDDGVMFAISPCGLSGRVKEGWTPRKGGVVKMVRVSPGRTQRFVVTLT